MPIPLYDARTIPVNGVVTTYKKVIALSAENPEAGLPSLTFQEGLVTIMPDGKKTVIRAGSLIVPYAPGDTFKLLSPDGEEIGTMSVDAIYQSLACLYFAKAVERDSKIAT